MGTSFLENRDEFARIMREHAPSMRARLRRVGIVAADIDDCIQEAFVKAWLFRDQMPSEPNERRAWLGRIAFHVSRPVRRVYERRHDACELAELAGDFGSSIEARAMLAEMLERLPEQYHEIVRLRADGYTIDDIAKHYGIPWMTAKSRWDRACVVMGARNG